MSNPNSTCEEPDGNTAPCIIKKKRSLPGHPDPDAEVIALSPRSLLATNRFVCEICNKGFQRDQNLQLHRRGHNLPWRLKQKASHEVKKKVYICPESTCAHHDPSRALGDLTGIKKHFSRKHGEKKWKCDKCSKRYAVQSDWKAHQKTCGTREYRCDCGTLFSRRDSFITHRAFCDALAEENAKTLTCRQGESQETAPANLDHTSHIASLGEDFSAAIKAPSSPTSQITRDVFTYTEVSKPQYTDRRASDFTSQEGSIVSNWVRRASDFVSPEGSVASKWVPGSHKSKIAASSKSPGLSLCLGMGPGPGPPGSLQHMMANLEGSGPGFNFLSHNTLDKLAFPQTSVYDTNMHASSSSSSLGAMGMLSSLFSSPKHGYGRCVDVGNGMFSALGFAGSVNELDNSTMRQFTAPSSRLSTSISSSMSGSENPLKGSSQHAAASSATALLQKAAQMGATASKPSLLQKFGIGGLGETMGAQEMQRQPTWNGASSMYSSSNSKPRQAGEYASHGENDVAADGCEAGGSAKVPTCASTCELISGYGSMQEFMRSVTAGGGGSIQNTWDDIPLSERGVPLPPRTAAGAARSSLSSLSAQSGLRVATPPPVGLQGLHRRDHEGDTPMVDFLGVGGSSGMVGLYSKCRNSDGQYRSLSSE